MSEQQPQQRIPPRLCVIETVYHQRPDQPPTATEARFTRLLSQDEQPWSREFQVGESWQALEAGWITHAGLLILANNEGRFTQMVPTKEEREVAQAKVVELAFEPAGQPSRTMHSPPRTPLPASILIPPGENARFSPADLTTIRVRCRSNTARCTLTLLPA